MATDYYDFHMVLCTLGKVLSPKNISFQKTDNPDFYDQLRLSAVAGLPFYQDREATVLQLSKDVRRVLIGPSKRLDKNDAVASSNFLKACVPVFHRMVDNYRYKSINLPTFFNFKRFAEGFAEVGAEYPEVGGMKLHKALAESLFIARDTPFSVTKEQLKVLWETYVDVASVYFNTLSEPVKDLVMLERLGLPKETVELKELVTTTEDLGDLFPWSKTKQGYLWWAKLYLDKGDYYRSTVYGFLNELDSSLGLAYFSREPTPRKEPLKIKDPVPYELIEERVRAYRDAAAADIAAAVGPPRARYGGINLHGNNLGQWAERDNRAMRMGYNQREVGIDMQWIGADAVPPAPPVNE